MKMDTHRDQTPGRPLMSIATGVPRYLPRGWILPTVDRDELAGKQMLHITTASNGPGNTHEVTVEFGGAVRLGRYYIAHISTYFDSAGRALAVDLEVVES